MDFKLDLCYLVQALKKRKAEEEPEPEVVKQKKSKPVKIFTILHNPLKNLVHECTTTNAQWFVYFMQAVEEAKPAKKEKKAQLANGAQNGKDKKKVCDCQSNAFCRAL